MKRRGSRMVLKPALGIAVLTPVVLAGAVAASPGGTGIPVKDENVTPLAAVEPALETEGVTVVAMPKTPGDFRFGSATLGPPPPAAVISSGGGMRIPAMALSAYRKAEQTMAATSPGCGVSWNLLAGIGRIESSHANGGATDARGTAVRPIYGPSLDGSLPGNEVIVQSNAGGRPVYARAMGPMQFLPGTWSRFASDGDGDGRADPQNLFDAALSTARYLCSGGLNLRNQAQVLTAILRYNNSMAYAENVLGWAAAYATGVAPVDLPAISGPVPALGDGHLENPAAGLGPDITGLPGSDPFTQLMGNTSEAGQMLPGPGAGPGNSVLPEHGCQVICMASQLAPTQAANPDLPPWMQPMAPPPWMTPQGPLPGMAPLGTGTGTGPLPGVAPLPGPAGAAAPLPGPADAAPLPGMPPAVAPLPGMPGAAPAPLPGMPGAAPGPLPGVPAAEAPPVPAPGTPPWMAPPPAAPGPAPAEAPVIITPVPGPGPGPAPGPA